MEKFQIFKIHSDFYYVHFKEYVFECKIREVLKKQKIKIFVGDFVELDEIDETRKTAVIKNVFPRKNFILRPSVSNIDQIVIVSAVKEPDLDFIQLNRYISFAKFYNLDIKLCFNKNDLSLDDSIIEKTFKIYEPLGFDIIFTSALEKSGLDDFIEILKGKTSVFCGTSGVGKTTLINTLCPKLDLRTKKISEKTSRGVHTTRHCEIITIDKLNSPILENEVIRIVDTPGFSNLKFDFLLPHEVDKFFDEIYKYRSKCKFKDCLHLNEVGCEVLKNLDKIDETRYASYKAFVEEAKEYKDRIKQQGNKKEENSKKNGHKQKVMISSRRRELSRNTVKQQVKDENWKN